MILIWLAGGSTEIAGTPLPDPESAKNLPAPVRAVLLLSALALAPLIMWQGPKFVTSGTQPYSTSQLLWAAVKVLIVMLVFGLAFAFLTYLSGSMQLSDALSPLFSLSIGITCFLALLFSGIREVAGRGQFGQVIYEFMTRLHGIVAAFSSGGPRGGIIQSFHP